MGLLRLRCGGIENFTSVYYSEISVYVFEICILIVSLKKIITRRRIKLKKIIYLIIVFQWFLGIFNVKFVFVVK